MGDMVLRFILISEFQGKKSSLTFRFMFSIKAELCKDQVARLLEVYHGLYLRVSPISRAWESFCGGRTYG